MSVKFENPSAIYNIPLNSSENDIFRIGSAHLQHFIQVNVKTDNCKPMMLKMHLELGDSPSIGEAGQRNIEHNSSINGLRQSVQQLEEEIKSLKDALQQAMDDMVNCVYKAPNVDNNGTQESNSNKQAKNEKKLSGEHNDTKSVASAIEEHHTNTTPEEKPQFIDLRDNCVYIRDFQCSDSSLERAFCNIRKLANEMNVKIPDDAVVHIEVQEKPNNYLDYYVYFCDKSIKEKFLRRKRPCVYSPETRPLRILNYSYWRIVDIMNIQSSDLSLETAYRNLSEIAEKSMIEHELLGYDLQFIECIDHIDVFSTKPNFLTYSVQFNRGFAKQQFLSRKDNLKQFPETKSLEISDGGDHRLNISHMNKVRMSEASASVIGVAELIGLSLATDDFKYIYVLNYVPHLFYGRRLSLIVEFYSKQVKDEFLKKKHKLEEMEYSKYHSVTISNVNAKRNVVSIVYEYDKATVISFIGLAKQLGFSLNPDQIQNFFDLSKFIDGACTTRGQ